MIRLIFTAAYLFGSIFLSGFTLMPLVIALDSVGLRRLSASLRAAIMRGWGRLAVIAAGGRVRVSGLENIPASDNVCFYANHQDYSDIAVLLGWVGRPMGFLGKRELGAVPVMSTWMRLSYSLFLDRKSLKRGLETIRRAARNLRKGRSIVIFPEGTRGRGGPVGEFRAGSFKAARMAGSWIVPVTLDGSWRFLYRPGRVTGGPVRVVIHPAIDSSALGAAEWKELPGRVRASIAAEIRLTPESEGFPARS
jgi:1-acyl-sn-glycerol-3-phosphate acyltransferase